MDTNDKWILIGILCVPLIMLGAYMAGWEDSRRYMRVQAIERGFAEYKVDKYGNSTFVWKGEPKNEK